STRCFFRGSYGIARFKCESCSNEFNFARRLILRTQGFCPQQPRCRGVLSPLLEYERTFFDRLSTLLRGRWRHHIVCRSALGIFTALDRSRSFFATKPVARAPALDAHQFQVAL